jgi:hypothetical protein
VNEQTLAAGAVLDAELARIEAAVRTSSADVPDIWPGRRNEALIHAERALEAIETARAEVGALIVVLAQDVAP